jgi:hypothetical protein
VEYDAGGRAADEDQRGRVNRELIELLNELRVALPGVQVLFAFLLTVPFSQGWLKTTSFQRDLFFTTLALTAISSALLIAPSAWHRLHFRYRDKEHVLITSNKLTIVGLGFLAAAMVGAVMLIADFIYSPALTIIAAVVAIVVFGLLWYALPIGQRPRGAGARE